MQFETLIDGTRVVAVKYLGDMSREAARDCVVATWVMPTTAEGVYMEPPIEWSRGQTHAWPFWEQQIAAFEADPRFEVTAIGA